MFRGCPKSVVAGAVLGLAVLAQGAQAGTSKYEYDALGRLRKVTEPDNTVINYTYDALGNRIVHATVNGQNQAPTAGADNVSTTVGTALTFNPRVNDTDPNGDPLVIVSVTQPASGTVTIGSGGRSVTYTPPAGVSATQTFSYTVADDEGLTSNAATVTVAFGAVNRPPTATADSATTTAGNSVIINPLTNDSDPDGDAITVTSVSVNPPGHGTATRTTTQITYTPTAGYTGADSLTYTISDGRGSTASATISITVTAANQSPTAANDSIETVQYSPITFDPRVNDSDPNGDPLTITGKTNGLHGTVAFTSTSLTYTPTGSYTGSDSFTYTISDGRGGSTTATVNVLIEAPGESCIPDPRTGICELGSLDQAPGWTGRPTMTITKQILIGRLDGGFELR